VGEWVWDDGGVWVSRLISCGSYFLCYFMIGERLFISICAL
jgi:hypothetical protein